MIKLQRGENVRTLARQGGHEKSDQTQNQKKHLRAGRGHTDETTTVWSPPQHLHKWHPLYPNAANVVLTQSINALSVQKAPMESFHVSVLYWPCICQLL